MAFLAGANSIFDGDKLLTTANNDRNEDMEMFDALGLRSRPAFLNYASGNDSSRDFTAQQAPQPWASSPPSASSTPAAADNHHHHQHHHHHQQHEQSSAGGCCGGGARAQQGAAAAAKSGCC